MLAINIDSIIDIAKQAGEKILAFYDSSHDFSVQLKSDYSPVTQADLISHNYIIENLKWLCPSIPIISEESLNNLEYEKRKHWKQFWLVDPLDGTKEFLKRNNQFTVNIALIIKNEPCLGVIYAPALDLLYFAEKGKGAYKQTAGKKTKLLSSKPSSKKSLRIAVSHSHLSPETQTYIEKLVQSYEQIESIPLGSSLKFCYVAEGKVDIYPRFGPTMEWDTAAGQCIALEANQQVCLTNGGGPLTYNKKNLRNPGFIVQRKG